jgi:hypothetical protein
LEDEKKKGLDALNRVQCLCSDEDEKRTEGGGSRIWRRDSRGRYMYVIKSGDEWKSDLEVSPVTGFHLW